MKVSAHATIVPAATHGICSRLDHSGWDHGGVSPLPLGSVSSGAIRGRGPKTPGQEQHFKKSGIASPWVVGPSGQRKQAEAVRPSAQETAEVIRRLTDRCCGAAVQQYSEALHGRSKTGCGAVLDTSMEARLRSGAFIKQRSLQRARAVLLCAPKFLL